MKTEERSDPFICARSGKRRSAVTFDGMPGMMEGKEDGLRDAGRSLRRGVRMRKGGVGVKTKVVADEGGSWYGIPMTWEMCGTILVKADSLERAYGYAKENADEIPLPNPPEYVDGSYAPTAECWEDCVPYQDEPIPDEES